MSKDDDPFGNEPSSTDAFGRPTSSGGDAFSSPAEPSTPPPVASDAWRTGPAPPPSGEYAMPPMPGRKADGAVAALVLGIIGVILCQLLAPVAWVLGRKAEQQVDASGGTLGGRGEATAGKVLGMIGTALMVIALIVFIVLIAIGASAIESDGGTSTTFEF